ncbi:mitochondrial 54S ribosomal protein bL35m Ecym_8202 [Eremothecium cymbalariae DBVPG|uniref:Large ribosomal subunit protein bL35c n=1 Tax=Eremothecium cymbalariae (strain CBS 270.75 / DBVPG 7215 / KCTC 17166 / NRRL Y-17582) TaxID=931890 RepID=G8JXB3_ERECY|nr:Hypothetical protein Ecym_8202 [Eremothecium cymbalariae DBVPG\
MLIQGLFRPLEKLTSRFGGGVGCGSVGVSYLIFSRSLMKTHKGAAKRWRKTANSFKRGKAGRSHGNSGWSKNSLKVLSGRALANGSQLNRLKRLLPYH